MKLTKKKQDELIKKFGHIPTEEEVFQKLIESQEKLAHALKGAWENAPDDPDIKKDLLEVGEKAAKLRREINKMFKKK